MKNHYLYFGEHINIRTVTSADAGLLHQWLESADFAYYRPCMSEMCPQVADLLERMENIGKITPPLEIEFIIEHKKSHAPIGAMSLSGIDYFNQKAEFSIGFVRGLGTRCSMEAFHFGIEQAFKAFKLRKLIFYVAAENRAAHRIMAHGCIEKEGVLRQELQLTSGVAIDLHRYALFQPAWLNGDFRRLLQRIAPLNP